VASAYPRRPPTALLLYLAGLAVLVLIDLFVPYETETAYEPLAAVVYLGLLAGVVGGSAICRRILVALGLYWVLAMMSLQSDPLEPVATAWTLILLGNTFLLLSPSVRQHTSRPR
jgi:peptidoglycan/LPS O-acetylase OafA/YrhL